VFGKIAAAHLRPDSKILDFGAGKLRNTLYLFKKGFSVFPVEFPKVFETEFGKRAEAQAHKYGSRVGRLRLLVYPHEFRKWTGKVDIALLINVLNIMPVPAERAIVLEECRSRLKKNGHLLWYSQYGDADYKRRCTDTVRLGDGFFIGTRRLYKTFYREFSASEMDSTMLGHGFEFVESYPIPNNHVRLYRKTPGSPVGRVVSRGRVLREVKLDYGIPAPTSSTPALVKRGRGVVAGGPDPQSVSRPSTLAEALGRLPTGRKHSGEFVKLARAILEYALIPRHLRKIKTERPEFGGRKRIDLFATIGEDGFFASLRPKHGIPAPYVHIECKNYKEDIGNPEFDQLKGRFSNKKGRFGMLVCRDVKDPKAVTARSHSATEDDHYILVLTDTDLLALIDLRKRESYDEIDELFAEMLEKIVME